MNTGQVGSRIVYCRLRGVSCNITVVGVYIPQNSRTNPDQKSTYDKLEKLLQSLGKQQRVTSTVALSATSSDAQEDEVYTTDVMKEVNAC